MGFLAWQCSNKFEFKKMHEFPMWVTRQGWELSLLLFNMVLKLLANAIRQEKSISLGKGKVKWYLFGDDIIVY